MKYITRVCPNRPSGARHDWLHVVNEFVADETDRAAREPRQAGATSLADNRFSTPFHHREPVAHLRFIFRIRVARSTVKDATDAPVLEMHHLLAVLPNDRARIAAHKRITPQMLAALDRFEQETIPPARESCDTPTAASQNPPATAAYTGIKIALRGQLPGTPLV
jgi:hypothetical protein